jgi:hypothetical protein
MICLFESMTQEKSAFEYALTDNKDRLASQNGQGIEKR